MIGWLAGWLAVLAAYYSLSGSSQILAITMIMWLMVWSRWKPTKPPLRFDIPPDMVLIT